MNPWDFDLHLFDLDDTLIHTRSVYLAAQETALSQVFAGQSPAQHQARAERVKFLSRAFGSSRVDQYLDAFLLDESDDPKQRDRLRLALKEVYTQEYWGKLNARDGAIAWLEQLKSKGKAWGLVSNGDPQLQEKKLQATGLSEWFPLEKRWVSGSFDPQLKKPNPFMIQEALKTLGYTAGQSVYYGNIPEDVIAAHLAGVQCCFLGALPPKLPPMAQPERVIQNWMELK